jgi:sec-independent protein translocase protein TatB
MFFDIAWPEFMVIGVIALIVIGPKDLPAALRVAGYWVRKARTLSREFHSSVEQMMREVELHEVQNELRKVTDINLDHEFNKIVDPVTEPVAASTAAASQPGAVPDYLDTTPAPVIVEPEPMDAEAEANLSDERELPLILPGTGSGSHAAEPEPARAAEPPKP